MCDFVNDVQTGRSTIFSEDLHWYMPMKIESATWEWSLKIKYKYDKILKIVTLYCIFLHFLQIYYSKQIIKTYPALFIRSGSSTRNTTGTVGAVPPPLGDHLQAHTVDMVATVTQVTKQHLILIGWVLQIYSVCKKTYDYCLLPLQGYD